MLTSKGLDLVRRVYGIENGVGARLPEPTETDSSPKESYVVIYELQVRNGLKFPVCPLLKETIKQYKISITQIFSLGIFRIMAFDACCRKARFLGVSIYLGIFIISRRLRGAIISVVDQKRKILWPNTLNV